MDAEVEKTSQAPAAAEEASSPPPGLTPRVAGDPDRHVAIPGRVSSGRGKACRDVTSSMQDLVASTGVALFPGSLNVVLDRGLNLDTRHAMTFDDGKRYLWPASVNGRRVWLYRWRGTPFHVVEILSENKLRDSLGLGDGDRIVINVREGYIDSMSVKCSLVSFLLWGLGRRGLYYHGTYADSHTLKAIRMRLRDGQR